MGRRAHAGRAQSPGPKEGRGNGRQSLGHSLCVRWPLHTLWSWRPLGQSEEEAFDARPLLPPQNARVGTHAHTCAHPRCFALCHARGLQGVPDSFLPMTASLESPAVAQSGLRASPDHPVGCRLLADLQSGGVKLISTRGHISLAVAFKGLNAILGLYKCNYSLTRGKELGAATG